jgi:hypothetical protein
VVKAGTIYACYILCWRITEDILKKAKWLKAFTDLLEFWPPHFVWPSLLLAWMLWKSNIMKIHNTARIWRYNKYLLQAVLELGNAQITEKIKQSNCSCLFGPSENAGVCKGMNNLQACSCQKMVLPYTCYNTVRSLVSLCIFFSLPHTPFSSSYQMLNHNVVQLLAS